MVSYNKIVYNSIIMLYKTSQGKLVEILGKNYN